MLSVKKTVSKVLNWIVSTATKLNAVYPLQSNVVISEYVTPELNIGANTNFDRTYTVTKAGYRPVGIVGMHLQWIAGQTALINTYFFRITNPTTGSGTLALGGRNMHSTTTRWTYRFYILWIKVGGGYCLTAFSRLLAIFKRLEVA